MALHFETRLLVILECSFLKNIDKYLTLKRQYKESILLIKTGNFYYTYMFDSLILNYLCNYQM